ncbi:hypothetical protein ACFFK7_06300 [Pseudoalteromonas xiamenensis]
MIKAMSTVALLAFSSATLASTGEMFTDWAICFGWGGFGLCLMF